MSRQVLPIAEALVGGWIPNTPERAARELEQTCRELRQFFSGPPDLGAMAIGIGYVVGGLEGARSAERLAASSGIPSRMPFYDVLPAGVR